jgi:thiol-disulfide isomerase/thioredoxin
MLGWMMPVSIWLMGSSLAEAKPCKCDETLPARVEALEAENRQLAARIEALEHPPPSPVERSAEAEQAAADLLKAAAERLEALDYDGARDRLAEMEAFSQTRAYRAAQRLRAELDVVGRDEVPFDVEAWFQGSEADVTAHPARLLVFWEVWCPHCKREVPKLEELYQRNRERLSVVGLTRLTRDVTEAQVRAFIDDNGVSYPIAKETGTMTEAYGVSGIPAAAIVDDGVVVWRGHPAKLTDEILDAVLGEAPSEDPTPAR